MKLKQNQTKKLKSVITILFFLFCSLLDPTYFTKASTEDVWQKINTTMFGGIIQDVIIHPKINDMVYIGTPKHGLYFSNDKGNTWTRFSKNLPSQNVQCIGIDPSDPYSILVGTPVGLFKSRNNGKSWTKAEGLFGSVNCIAITKKGMIFVGTNQGVFKKEDKMEFQFYQLIDNYVRNSDIRSIMIHPIESKIIFSGTFDKGILMTVDNGNNWVSITRNLPKTFVTSLMIHPDKPNLLLAGLMDDGLWTFPLVNYQVGDTTIQWTSILYSNSPQNLQVTDMTINYSKPREIYASTKNLGIFSFMTDSQAVRNLNLDNNFQSVMSIASIESNKNFVLLGTYGRGVVKTINNGIDWIFSNNGIDAISVTSLTIDKLNNQKWYAVSYGCLFLSDDAGKNWEMLTNQIPISDITEIQIDPFNPSKFLIATNEGLFVSTNECKNWSLVESLRYKLITTISINPYKPNIYYAGTNSKGIYKSVDAGTNWSLIELDADKSFNNNTITVIRFDPIYSNNLYLGTSSNGIYKSKSDGKYWNHIYYVLDTNTYINDLQINDSSDLIYAGVKIINKGGFIKSEDQGKTWESTNLFGFGMIFQKIAVYEQNENIIFSGTNEGAFFSKDRGYHWNPINNGIESFIEESVNKFCVYSLLFDPSNSKRMIMSSDYGLFEFNISKSKLIIDKPTIEIISPLTKLFYTNQPKLTIVGKITDIHGIKNSTLNDAELSLDTDGNFKKELSLNKGQNIFIIKAQDNDNNSSEDQVTVIFDDKNPILEIDSPKNLDTVASNRVIIKGKASDENTGIQSISINEELVEMIFKDDYYFFEHTIKKLKNGENKIEIIAKDFANNEARITLFVISNQSIDNRPIIDLIDPVKEKSYTNKKEITIKGRIYDKESTINKATINNFLLNLDKDGFFSFPLKLGEEKTFIAIRASNQKGIKTEITLTIIIDQEVPRIILINPVFTKNVINNYYNPFPLRFQVLDHYSNVDKITIYLQDKEIKKVDPLDESTYEEMLSVINGLNKIKIDVVDSAGNRNSISFTLNHIPSTIISLQIGNKKVIVKKDGIETELILDTPPIIRKSRTLVPIRFIAEVFGAKVKWIPAPTNEVQIDYNKQFVIHLWLSKSYAYIEYPKRTKNQNEKKPLDTNPIIQNGRVLVPLRIISDVFKAITNWNAQKNQIEIVLPLQ